MIEQSEAVRAGFSALVCLPPGLDRGGVYAITCLGMDSRYIGSSSNLRERLEKHRKMLIEGAHKNAALQELWNAQEGAGFRFEVLEYVDDVGSLWEREAAALNAAIARYGRWCVLNTTLQTDQGTKGRANAARRRLLKAALNDSPTGRLAFARASSPPPVLEDAPVEEFMPALPSSWMF
jgi:hypothetical protein